MLAEVGDWLFLSGMAGLLVFAKERNMGVHGDVIYCLKMRDRIPYGNIQMVGIATK